MFTRNQLEETVINFVEGFLETLPCSWDRPNQISFLVGSNSSPYIKFYPATKHQYNLDIKEENGRFATFPVLVGDKKFEQLQEINREIRKLTEDEGYKNLRSDPATYNTMLKQVDDHVKFVLDHLESIN